jgi:hypothetical protein
MTGRAPAPTFRVRALPGPWRMFVSPRGIEIWQVSPEGEGFDSAQQLVATLAGTGRAGKGLPPSPLVIANGHLMAAAAELRDVLTGALELLEDVIGSQCEPDCECYLHVIRAALRRAEGLE